MKLQAVDLFCGCGGLSLGMELSGIELLGAFENWDKAAENYRKNFHHPLYEQDLTDTAAAVEIIKGLEPNMIVGGPPCQDYSHAGKRTEGDRAQLTQCFADIVTTVHPEFFIMENVDRAQKSKNYQAARETLKGAGYGLTELVLDASLCGVPQKRKRFFCIGVQGMEDGILLPYLMKHLSGKPMTVRDYFGDSLGLEYYYRHPRNYSRRGVFSIDEPAPTVRGVNRPIPKTYPGHPGDLHPVDETVRPLTTEERAQLQTFPKSFILTGTKTDREQMIGNAVPVNLAKYVGNALQEFIHDREQNTIQGQPCLF